MSSPGGYGRFLEHIEGKLGGIKHVESPEVSGSNRGYALIYTDLADPGVATVTTNGVRFQQITSMLPAEFTCSLQEDQEHIARYLVDTVAGLAISSGGGLEYEQVVVKNDQPIIADTAIHGILTSPSPFFGGEFDLYRDDNGQPSLQIITLLPVTSAEADFVEEADAEELYDIWRENRTNLLNVYRESAL
ncbi:suppressor of fused domain protein [Nocardia pneumoniae]|uniref:suppressor of fused domain protein n=1 Tax=Nocardia pneumoniae TaxID=228601 RepID=UPI0002D2E625|nr:suppressor of fused domain protein [Nocardia pneumoniae]